MADLGEDLGRRLAGHAQSRLEHRVVGPVTGEPVAPGELGELWVRGYALMDGLYKRERAEVFAEGGWYRTGDGGFFVDDGHFHYPGRMGEQIKSAGTLVTPREVELILEGFEEVSSAFVTGIPHPDRGEDIAAAVVLQPGATAEPVDLRARVKAEISSYKVPRHLVTFADAKELPWLASGKVDRRALRQGLIDRFGTTRSVATDPRRD